MDQPIALLLLADDSTGEGTCEVFMMAITKANLAGMWLRRDGSIAGLAVRYGVTAEYVEEAVRECASKQRLLDIGPK